MLKTNVSIYGFENCCVIVSEILCDKNDQKSGKDSFSMTLPFYFDDLSEQVSLL